MMTWGDAYTVVCALAGAATPVLLVGWWISEGRERLRRTRRNAAAYHASVNDLARMRADIDECMGQDDRRPHRPQHPR